LADRPFDPHKLTIVVPDTSIESSSTGFPICSFSVRSRGYLRHRVAVRILNLTDREFRVVPGVEQQPGINILGDRDVACRARAETNFEYEIPAVAFSAQRPLVIVRDESGASLGVLGNELGDRVLWCGALVAAGVALGAAAIAFANSDVFTRTRQSTPKPQAPARGPEPESEPEPAPQASPLQVDPPTVPPPSSKAFHRLDDFFKIREPARQSTSKAEVTREDGSEVESEVESEPEPEPEPETEPEPAPQASSAPSKPPPVPAPSSPALGRIDTRGLASSAAESLTAVAFGDERVAATLEQVATHWTGSEYVAKVVNQTNDTLWCSIVGKSARGRTLFAREPFSLDPESAAAVPVVTPLRVVPNIARLVMYMSAPSLQCTTEAVVGRPRIVVFAIWFSLVVCALALVAYSASTVLRPRVDALVVAKNAIAGQPISVSYATAGHGAARYLVEPALAKPFGGNLAMGRHDFVFPTSRTPQRYRVLLSVAGALGQASQAADVATLARPAHVETASVRAIEAVPPVASSGQKFAVRYEAKAASGTIVLRDPLGLTVASQPFVAAGSTQLVAPTVTAPTMYQVELRVALGSSSATASTGILVMPVQAGDPTPPAGADVAAAALVRIVPERVLSAQNFNVQLLAHPSNLQLTLQDQRGAPIASITIPKDWTAVTFRAPLVFSPTTITLIVSYRTGSVAHLAFQPIAVHPR
jgi:hypothetical protein